MTGPLSDAARTRLRELCDAATPGPWHVEACGDYGDKTWIIPDVLRERYGNNALSAGEDAGTAEFIAAARDALPRLLDENTKKAAEVDKVSRLLAGARARGDQLERNWEQLIGPLLHTLDPDGDEDLTGEAPSEIIAAVAEQAAEIARLRAEVANYRKGWESERDRANAHWEEVEEQEERAERAEAERDAAVAKAGAYWNGATVATERAERAEAERDQAQAAIQQLRDVATDRIPHVYEGDCPDALDGHDRRDPACRACEVLSSTDVQTRTGTL